MSTAKSRGPTKRQLIAAVRALEAAMQPSNTKPPPGNDEAAVVSGGPEAQRQQSEHADSNPAPFVPARDFGSGRQGPWLL